MEYLFLQYLFFVLLLKLPLPVSEKITVTGQKQPIIALVDGEAIIPCHLSPQIDAQDMDVMWFYGQSSQPVHHYKNGQDDLRHQHQKYKGRTEFLRDDISNGSVALKLHHIRPSDEGKYWCLFEGPSAYEEEEFKVYVAGKGSTPHIHVENDGNKGVRLVCTSTGWYPEPKVQWRKNQEESLSQDTKIMKNENGLFSIETSITASSDSTVNVSCFIWNHLLNQRLEASVSLPDALSPNDPSWMVIVPVVLIIAVCIIFIVTWNLKKGKGMCKDESGIAKVESDSLLQPSAESNVATNSLLQPSAESNVATSVSKNATGMCKDESGIAKVESGMGESETDSLLQPSAESNVATSVSKNATGASKDASGVIKHEPGVIKYELLENIEANTALMQRKNATAALMEQKEATVENIEVYGVIKHETGVIKHEPVVKKEATAALMQRKNATAVINAAIMQRKNATAALMEQKEATVENIEAYGLIKHETGVIKHEPVVKKEATAALMEQKEATDEPEFLRKHKEIMRKQNGENMERLTGTHAKGNEKN